MRLIEKALFILIGWILIALMYIILSAVSEVTGIKFEYVSIVVALAVVVAYAHGIRDHII